jgi:hypothetical protein
MNAIGVDYQRTLSVVCLREGESRAARVRLVGDGRRPLIPNAVHAAGAWGSAALCEDLAEDAVQPDLAGGPWTDRPAVALWKGLYERLYHFLGRVRPKEEEGFRVVVAIQAEDQAAAAGGVERLAREAGFADVAVIPAATTVLCRWLAEQEPGAAGERVVAVAAVGDTSAQVAGYRVASDTGRPPRVVQAAPPTSLGGTGHAWWTATLLRHVRDRLAEPPSACDEPALREAALEFGARLGRSAGDGPLAYTGPCHEQLASPLSFRPAECAAWPEAAALTLWLPDALREATRAVAGKPRPDLILVGGVGAAWPFAAEAARLVGPVWPSDSPEEDVARGRPGGPWSASRPRRRRPSALSSSPPSPPRKARHRTGSRPPRPLRRSSLRGCAGSFRGQGSNKVSSCRATLSLPRPLRNSSARRRCIRRSSPRRCR